MARSILERIHSYCYREKSLGAPLKRSQIKLKGQNTKKAEHKINEIVQWYHVNLIFFPFIGNLFPSYIQMNDSHISLVSTSFSEDFVI